MVPDHSKDMSLVEKLKAAATDLESRSVCGKPELKRIRGFATNSKNSLSVDTLNAYVHNKDYSPTAADLKTAWDNIQVFMESLWSV